MKKKLSDVCYKYKDGRFLKTSYMGDGEYELILTVEITKASPNFVIAEGMPISIRKTVGGDASEARSKEAGPQPLMVGMPTLMQLKARN